MDIGENKIEDNKAVSGLMRFGAIVAVLVGAVLTFCLFKKINTVELQSKSDTVITIIIGLIGPLFSLGGFFLLYLTLQNQKENFDKERLESSFFEMIKFHRDNVSEIQYPYYEKKFLVVASVNSVKVEEFIASNKKVFTIIYNEFCESFNELDFFFRNVLSEEIYTTEYLLKLRSNETLKRRKIDLTVYAKADIIYSIIFFGVSVNGKNAIRNLLKFKYKKEFLTSILDFASLKPHVKSKYWLNWMAITQTSNKIQILQSILNKRIKADYDDFNLNEIPSVYKSDYLKPYYPNKYIKYYGGHQFRLGHYFRHLYQSVSFIDSSKILSYEEKYKYIKFLRGQISTFEQIIFFLNSISSIGRIWELEDSFSGDLEVKFNRKLITKYNLIKNIPTNTIKEDIHLTSFYPTVNYEAISVDGIREMRKHFADNLFT